MGTVLIILKTPGLVNRKVLFFSPRPGRGRLTRTGKNGTIVPLKWIESGGEPKFWPARLGGLSHVRKMQG